MNLPLGMPYFTQQQPMYDYTPQGTPSYHQMYAQPRTSYMQTRPMYQQEIRRAMPLSLDKSESSTKARLAKDQVEILEARFQENQKPNSQTKRQLADEFCVELPRINNWFQNRRAKAKQERKQAENDRQLEEDDESSSEDNYNGDLMPDEAYGIPIEQRHSASLDHSLASSYESLIEVPVAFNQMQYTYPESSQLLSHTGDALGIMMTRSNDGLADGNTWAQYPQNMAFSASNASSPIELSDQAMLNTMHYPRITDIASRRHKPRPANLGIEAVRGNMGPRSYSSSDVPAHQGPSPTHSVAMRRVTSNGMGNVIGGRVVKKSSTQQLRSPVRYHFNDKAQACYPPTPSSSYDQPMNRTISASKSVPDLAFSPYSNNTMVNTTSPPETPQHHMNAQQWDLTLMDQPLHSSSADYFPQDFLDMSILPQQMQYPVSSLSVPSTPLYGNMSGMYPMASPQIDQSFEHLQLGWQAAPPHVLGSSPLCAQPKNFVFNNQTPETVKKHSRRC